MSRLTLLLALTLASACAARGGSPPTATAAAAPSSAGPDPNLNAVVWMQTALEYEATALQAYQLARLQLDAGLRTPSWTAALEQTDPAEGLPPAVIVDVDETVLDNSYFQARLIRDGAAYDERLWEAWVEERRATAVPGAVDFTRYASQRGVTVFYVTNRMRQSEPATRDNLAALGFPVDAHADTVLTRGERPEWAASGKGPRRAHVAARYRILLLVGDDLGDFVDPAGTPEQRKARTAAHADRWGRRWVMLPNPTYGSWERAVIGPARDPVHAKRGALRYDPE